MARRSRPRHRKRLLTPSRRTEIAELAAAVADEHSPADPIQPERFARTKGLTLSFGHYGAAFDGMLEHLNGRFHIYCNTDRVGRGDSPRGRFTLAHELGHYYIDEHRRALAGGRTQCHGSRCDWESPNLAEQEADHFAANLLMPAGRFAARARAAPKGLAGIIDLARHFGSSLTAAALRYVACDPVACAVVKWNWDGYAWKMLSSATFEARYRRTVEARADLPVDSPTRRALARDVPPDRGFFTAGVTAATWFPAVEAGDFRDILLVEQAVPLGRYGVLSFLYAER